MRTIIHGRGSKQLMEDVFAFLRFLKEDLRNFLVLFGLSWRTLKKMKKRRSR